MVLAAPTTSEMVVCQSERSSHTMAGGDGGSGSKGGKGGDDGEVGESGGKGGDGGDGGGAGGRERIDRGQHHHQARHLHRAKEECVHQAFPGRCPCWQRAAT